MMTLPCNTADMTRPKRPRDPNQLAKMIRSAEDSNVSSSSLYRLRQTR